MLHIHFGTGRLGLGLVAPFLQKPESELYLLNRANSGQKPTGTTALDPARRNELLRDGDPRTYWIDTPGQRTSESNADARESVNYSGFFAFDEGNLGEIINQILNESTGKREGVIVTASVLTLANYQPVVDALNMICGVKEAESNSIGEVYLIACENTVSAYEVLKDQTLCVRVQKQTHQHVRCADALVDRVCVDVEERVVKGKPTVVVLAEEYGSLKVELCPHTEGLTELLRGSRAEFSHYLEVEKEIKSWLLNGSHWLMALTAFRESGGNPNLRLNDFINETENHRLYATEVIGEMRDGIQALLHSEPQYAGFIKDVDSAAYLDGAASSILARFRANDDTLTRILARFRAPTPEQVTTVESFVERFLNRIEPPLLAYQAEKGVPPKSATQGVFNLVRLQASGTYVDTAGRHETKVA